MSKEPHIHQLIQLDNDENSVLKDLSSKELVAVGPLLVLMLFIGVYPSFI